jgi:hypothetical protein
MSEWRPIESAPKDGTNFLAASPASDVFFAHWASGVVDSSDYCEDSGYAWRHATHWMSLPAPPAASTSEVQTITIEELATALERDE